MKPRSLSAIRLSLPLATAIAALLGATLALADTFTYTVPDAFTTGTDNWSTDAKWNAVPVSDPTTSLVFTLQATGNSQTQTTGSVNNITTVNPNSAFQLNTLTFNSQPSAGNGTLIVALNISGNALDFASNGPTTPVINLNGNRTNGQAVQFNVANNVTLGTGTIFTGNGTATFNFSGIVSGSSGFTKSGTSTLTLSNGSNDFTGGVTLSAGGLALGSTTALGNNTVSVTGNSQISATSGTISNTISVSNGTVLSLQNIGAANSTTTFSSAITGTGVGITLVAGGGSTARTVELSNTNNNFTGNITLPTGSGSNDFLTLASMGDGGAIVYGRASWRSVVTYNGAAALNLGTRSISLASTFGGFGNTPGLDGNGNPINMFQSNGGVVTISPDMVVASSANNGVFYFGGSNTGNNTFSGLIADNPGAGTLGIGKWDGGKWIISNANNSFNGNVYIGNGTLSVTNLQALGNGSVIQLGLGNTTGILEYTGSANASTAKQTVIGNLNNNNHSGSGTILSNGDGTLTFTNATFNSQVVPWTATNTLTTRDRTLTLGGSNTGANTISGVIQDNNTSGTNNAWVAVTKSDDGTWVLSGDNTYTGATSVTGGTLLINGNSSTATGAVSVTGGTLGGIGTVGGATSIGAAGTLSPGQSPGTMTFANTLSLAGSTIMEIDGANGAGVTGGHDFVNLTGAGAAGVLTYGGTMTIDIGVLFGAGSYSWNLFDFASEGVTSGFTGITLADKYSGFLTDSGGGVWGLVDGNNTWSFTESDGVLGLTVIPEPRAALLGGLGLLMLLRRRRR